MTKYLLILLTAAALSILCASCASDQTTINERPNIILIMGDDMGYSDLGCYGGEISTPHLDDLAAKGLRYTHFYNTARCCPTRASLLTGLYPQQAGVGHMMSDRGTPAFKGDLSANARTIAEVLKTAGYATYMSGKWHVTPYLPDQIENHPKHNWPRNRGFDKFFGTILGAGSLYDPASLAEDLDWLAPSDDFYYTDAISDHAIKYIENHKNDTPFFMYVAHVAAHWPMQAHQSDIEKYQNKYDDGWDAIRNSRLNKLKDLGIVQQNVALTPRDERVPAWTDSVENRDWHLANMETYAAMIERMDFGIGRIVEALKNENVFENTLILFLQDNGGCAEELQWVDDAIGPDDRPLKPEEFQTRMVPLFSRDGIPVRVQDPSVMPGPSHTYHAYGKNWANVSNTPFRLYKHWVHEGGIASPLIAHWPNGIKNTGVFCAEPSHLIDIMATCVDLAGATYPKFHDGQDIVPMQGTSLAPTFADDPLQSRTLFWEHEGNRAVREGKWKLVSTATYNSYLHDRTDEISTDDWELYDLGADRVEMNNLAKTNPERVQQMASEWQAWGISTGIVPRPN